MISRILALVVGSMAVSRSEVSNDRCSPLLVSGEVCHYIPT